MGLPGHRLLRPDLSLRRSRRLPLVRRPPAPARHRRDRRLGARPLPQGRVGAWPASTAARSTSTPTPSGPSTPTGARSSSTTAAPRCATSSSPTPCTGWASSTSTGSASTPSPRCSTSTTRGVEGQWSPNAQGGNEDLEAVAFLQELNTTVHRVHPGVLTIAEESTAWGGVSRPVHAGGLGFTHKWNMGWMHDTLDYWADGPDPPAVAPRPAHLRPHLRVGRALRAPAEPRRGGAPQAAADRQDARRHDDERFANLRALFAWMWAHPGKQLLFMGSELAETREWSHDRSLDWGLLDDPRHAGVAELDPRPQRARGRAPRAAHRRRRSRPGSRGSTSSDAEQQPARLRARRAGRRRRRGVRGQPLRTRSATATGSGCARAGAGAPRCPPTTRRFGGHGRLEGRPRGRGPSRGRAGRTRPSSRCRRGRSPTSCRARWRTVPWTARCSSSTATSTNRPARTRGPARCPSSRRPRRSTTGTSASPRSATDPTPPSG